MATCIGRIAGRPGDWYAELNFDRNEATVLERQQGGHIELATVPLGRFTPETPKDYAKLDPDDAQNKRLCAIVFAPEAWAALKLIREALADVPDPETAHSNDDRLRAFDIMRDEMVDLIDRTLDGLEVPAE